MISVSSMLMFSMQYNMRVFYRNSSSDSEGHMCCDGRREAGSLSSEGQHNKPTTGFRHVDLLRLSSSVGSWLASHQRLLVQLHDRSWLKEVQRTHSKLFCWVGLLQFCTTMPPKAFTNSLPDSTKCIVVDRQHMGQLRVQMTYIY
jgi:hypothetical protein